MYYVHKIYTFSGSSEHNKKTLGLYEMHGIFQLAADLPASKE
jgi:hypothetical protein